MSPRPKFLLDTNIISDLVRNPRGLVSSKIAAVGEGAICTSIVVAAELRYGAAKAASEKLSDRVDLLLSALEVIPLEAPTDWRYAEVRDQLARSGTPIGPNDLLIAAHALALEMTLVTANVREFSRVLSLPIENWLDQ